MAIVEEGQRKWWMGVIVVVALLLGMLIMLAFNKFTESMWTAWCIAVAGTGGGYAAANVVSKTIDNPATRNPKTLKGKK
jgi:protein-S-isoprenylcysteine O-methyltransferase Ste14